MATMDRSAIYPRVVAGSVPRADTSWRDRLPDLRGDRVTLRDLRASDAPSLCALLATEEVSRFISPPPSTLDRFERFITWTQRQRTAGGHACYGVTADGRDTAIGIFQVRELTAGFDTGEWGFAIGSQFWGTGVFPEAADLVLQCAFETRGVRRLEARAAVTNGRGTGALLKMRAVQEGLLRKSFYHRGEYHDQVLYAILNADWRATRYAARTVAFAGLH